MSDLRDLVKYEDPELTPAEKETAIHFSKGDERAEVYTAEAGLSRRLLAHAYVEVEGVTVADGDRRDELAVEDLDGDEAVVGVRATMPIGALLVKSAPRADQSHAEVVTDRVLGSRNDREEGKA